MNAHRLPDDSHDPQVLAEEFKNLLSATKEAAMPFSVSRTEHEFVEMGPLTEAGEGFRTFMWLGRTAVENAMSGYRYHQDPAARKRVDVEVAEALDAEQTLRPGVVKVFLSPRMSRKDAPYEVAKQEHLGDDDSLRISYCKTDERGNITARVVESLLVRDVPLSAWVAMLADPQNVFGKSIAVRDSESALAVMEVFGQLELSPEALPEGVIGLVAAVLPYVEHPLDRLAVEHQLELFRGSQEAMQATAESIAQRWLRFETELADSLHTGWATPHITGFISKLQCQWNDDDLAVILGHQVAGNKYVMSRRLAVILEQAQQNMLWTRAAVATGNEEVIGQIKPELVAEIQAQEAMLQSIVGNADLERQFMMLQANTDRSIAEQNVTVGGGCAGDNEARFRGLNPDGSPVGGSTAKNPQAASAAERKDWKTHVDTCVVPGCPTRPGKVQVGPCGVCMGRCQRLYDAGKDPSKGVTARRVIGSSVMDEMVSALQTPRKPKDRKRRADFALAA